MSLIKRLNTIVQGTDVNEVYGIMGCNQQPLNQMESSIDNIGTWTLINIKSKKKGNKTKQMAFSFTKRIKSSDPCDYLVIIDEIEKQTGLDLMPELPSVKEEKIESREDIYAKQLYGCQ